MASTPAQPRLALSRLRTLQAVAREGSVTAAARLLGYSQPAISHQIDRLEADVGTPLFTRVARGVQLTEAGRALLAHADVILAHVTVAEEDVAAIAGLRAGTVRLASFPSGGAMVVPAALRRLRSAYPNLAVSFVEAEPPESLPMLRQGDVDLVLAFDYVNEPAAEPVEYQHIPLFCDPLYAVVAPHHPLAELDVIELSSLADDDWIAGCPSCRRHLVSACHDAGFEPRITMATDDYVAIQSLIAAGLGVAALPALTIAAHRRHDIVVRPLTNAPRRVVAVVLGVATRRPPAVEALLAALEAAGTELALNLGEILGVDISPNPDLRPAGPFPLRRPKSP